MSRESGIWRLIKANIDTVHFARIEAWNAQGIADLNGCEKSTGIEFWVELKMAKGNKVEFRQYQIPWILNRAKARGRVFIFVRKGDIFYLYKGEHAREVQTHGILYEPLAMWPKPWPWSEILKYWTGNTRSVAKDALRIQN